MNKYIIYDCQPFLKPTDFLNDPRNKLLFIKYLGRFYHSYFGFRPAGLEYTLCPEEDSEEKMNCICSYAEYEEESPDYLNIDVELSQECLQEDAQAPVEYSKIIIKYTDPNYWREKPSREWYNQPSRWFLNVTKPHLDYLQSRGYIKVLDPFMKVYLDADLKGNPLTYDDILFATRALCVDDTRTMNDYRILGVRNGILELEPEIDNWST